MTTNLKSKTLIANWVEERGYQEENGVNCMNRVTTLGVHIVMQRQCALLEEGNRNPDGTLSTKLHREGHKGILSTELEAPTEASTTVKDSYISPTPLGIRTTGKRQEELKRKLYDMVSSQVHEEFHPPPPPIDYTSTTKKDFSKDFTPSKISPTKEHDLFLEQPVSYWSENLHTVTGVTQVNLAHTPFNKNTAFSTPIEEYMDQPKPHGIG